MTAIPALKPFIRSGVVLLACLATPVVQAQTQTLPALGETSAAVVSSVEETRLGRQFMRTARRQMEFSADPELVEYIRGLGTRLVSGVDLAPEEFTFSVVNDPRLNAFAVPGGFISVHSGLIATTASESELASVMAHEIAHITQRHLPRMIARAKERSIPAAAAMVAAILVGGQMGSAALVGANAALAADQLRYSRDFETEADAMGIRILAASGFDATAMPKFFQKLQNQTMLHASEAPEYLRTHPLSVNRIADSESRAQGYATASHRSSTDYLMMRARVRALMAGDPLRAAGNFADAGQPDGDEALAARYGEGLARMAAGQYDVARSIFDELSAAFPENRYIALARGQLALRRGDAAGAMDMLGSIYENDPNDVVAARYYAQALMTAGRLEDARRVVRRWQRGDPSNPETWRLMSRIDGELGRQAEAFQSRAEYLVLMFETRRAIEELERARQLSGGDYYLTSSIDARIGELRDELVRYDEDENLR